MDKKKLMQTTDLLDVFARNIKEEAKHIAIARTRHMPLYEVVSGNTTLDLTRFFKDANALFDKYRTVRMYKVVGGFKSLYRVKRNDRVLSGDLDAIGQAGI